MTFFPSSNVTWYGTYSKGYKPGATNLTPGYPAYLPETNEVLEFGAKSTLLDNRLRLNGALFYSEIENFQLLSLLSVGGGAPLPTFQNGTKGESQGVELELTYARDQPHSTSRSATSMRSSPRTTCSTMAIPVRTSPFRPAEPAFRARA